MEYNQPTTKIFFALDFAHAVSSTLSYVQLYQVKKTFLRRNYFDLSPQPWHQAALVSGGIADIANGQQSKEE